MSLRLFRLTTSICLLCLLLSASFFQPSGVFAAFPSLFPTNVTIAPDSPIAGSSVFIPLIYKAQPLPSTPKVNIPYFDGEVNFGETAIFWFGKVNPADNYADVRIAYNAQELWVHIAVFDRLLWYDDTPSPSDLTAWDAVTLLLKPGGNVGALPDSSSYRLVAQLHWLGDDPQYRASYRGNGAGWSLASIPFTGDVGWASLNNPDDNNNDLGWLVTLHVPFSSLGLSAPPPPGSQWGLGVILHDRDSQAGPPLADKTWPKNLDVNQPATWGRLGFGLPSYTPPPYSPGGTLTVRHKLNSAVVKDGHVGGSTNCGDPFNPNFFNGWGDANYNGATQVNIQNQANLGDWPCFSKFYITFPLDALPAGKVIRSARLTLYQFGNSDPSQAYDSLIQVFTVNEDWNEASLTWNNAPYAWENIAQTWVNPLPGFPGLPGVPNDWDVTRAVADAYRTGSPLRLALYEADFPMHSGKYFYSSDVDDGMPTSRPTLTIEWGNP